LPANLSPEFNNAEKDYKAAKTPEDKLLCLQRMLSTIPKHKGTEKMQADIKRRIAQLKERLESHSKKKGPSYRVKPEGAGQIALIGPPNSGKSSLLAALSRAEPVIADYPFSTREPIPGMLHYLDIQIQLLDLPPISKEHRESFVFDNIRGADGALLMLDLGASDPAQDYRESIDILQQKKIRLIQPDAERETEEASGFSDIRSLLVFSKCDLDPDGELAELAAELILSPLPVYSISAHQKINLDNLAKDIFDLLHVIRVYSKHPGKPPDMNAPFTAPMGCDVMGFAGLVHKDFAEHLKSARIWGSAKFDGQIVQRDHVLQDGDIVELSM